MADASYLLHSPASKQWQKIGTTHHHGLNIPLFSLHSQNSYGIGEYPDLIPVIHWCKSIGFDLIQLLPLNDTNLETSPYGAVSAFALNPIHLSLTTLPYLEQFPELLEELKALPKFSNQIRIDYEKVRETKYNFLRRYYNETKLIILSNEAYNKFISEADWLKGYALFKVFKVHFKGADWETWPTDYQNPTPELIDQWIEPFREEIEWHFIIQYLCDSQLTYVKTVADEEHVLLMGDIPILINRDSADVWLHPKLFHLNYSAGSPPDQFSETGQNWGFPIYNWEKIAEDNFSWWVKRIKWSSRYFHICRIDHIVGFFRIWAIPFGEPGTQGIFIPTDPNKWIDHGQRIMLMMLEGSDMLLIGEDLGVVPPEVRKCLSALGICGTRVMRWERNWNGDGQYISPSDYSLDSMTTVSTHDSETVPLWWQQNAREAEAYAYYKGWSYQPLLSREHLKEILWESHHSNSLFHINLLQEYLSLIPGMTQPNLEDERINVPGTVTDKNWTYRFTPSIEEITSNTTLKHFMSEMTV
jgi:4-alpha-glucanotransferase